MNVLEKINDGFNLVGKLISFSSSVANSAIRIYHKKKRKQNLNKKDKIIIATDVVFCAVQGIDLIFGTARLVAPKKIEKLCLKMNTTSSQMGVGLSTASGVTDVSRMITYKVIDNKKSLSDIADVIAVIIFRATDIINHTKQLEQLSESEKEIVEWVGAGGQIAGTAFGGALSTVRVYRERDKIYKATKIIFGCMKRTDAITVINLENRAEMNADKLEEESRRTILHTTNWFKTPKIPELLKDDPIFSKYKCAISREAIRFPVRTIRGTQNVWYEKETLFNWMKMKPLEKPPLWPEDLDFIPAHCTRDKDVQNRIDNKFKFYAEVFKQAQNN